MLAATPFPIVALIDSITEYGLLRLRLSFIQDGWSFVAKNPSEMVRPHERYSFCQRKKEGVAGG